MIAFYYGLTGFACVAYYRKELFKSAKNFFFIGVSPMIGGLILLYVFVVSVKDFWDPANSESGDAWFGIGPPLVIGVGFLILGLIISTIGSIKHPTFFKRKLETADPRILTGEVTGTASFVGEDD